MDKRLNITVSFSNHKKEYDYVVSKPNSSHYIRKLVSDDMQKENSNSNNDDMNISLNEDELESLKSWWS